MTLPHEKIFKFLKRFPDTQTIIVNGGDPLMVPPAYYWKIIKYLDDNDLKATVSLTTNLWDFKVRPAKWIDLFNHSRVGVGTSFQYGDARRITKDRVFKEEDFLEIMEMFNDKIGYYPPFIAVIDESNEDTVIATVQLAKKLGVVCKINYANVSGRQGSPYPLSKVYKHYVDLIELGLYRWEYNTQQIMASSAENTCPLSRDCDVGIRALNPDGSYYSCGSFADDGVYSIDFDKEMDGELARPLSNRTYLYSLKHECLSCPMFDLCNGCRKHVFDIKNADTAEDHCERMKVLAPRIIEYRRIYGIFGKNDRNDSTP